MPRYYKNEDEEAEYTPRIKSAMEDAMRFASERVPEDAVIESGGFLKNDPTAGAIRSDVPVNKKRYYDRLESNLRELGDTQGVMKVQKEREELLAIQRKAQDEEESKSIASGKRKRETGDDRLKYFGSLAKKNLDIYKTGGPEAATEYMRNARAIAIDAGLLDPNTPDEEEFDPKSAQVLADHYDKNYGWKEDVAVTKAAKTGGGKGGTPTSFNQIVDKLRKELKISGEPLIKMAREVYSEGKYNRNAAAVSLKKGGMSEEGIRKFLDKLEGKESTAPTKMKVSKDKVKFID